MSPKKKKWWNWPSQRRRKEIFAARTGIIYNRCVEGTKVKFRLKRYRTKGEIAVQALKNSDYKEIIRYKTEEAAYEMLELLYDLDKYK